MAGEATSDHARKLLRILAETAVRPSYERCCQQGSAIFDAFYAHLADRLPGVGSMFAHTDMHKQNELIRQGILALIDYATGQDAAKRELQRLGILHGRTRLNVEPELYDGWVDALMEMVSEYDGQHTAEIESAWREVVAPGIELMKSRY